MQMWLRIFIPRKAYPRGYVGDENHMWRNKSFFSVGHSLFNISTVQIKKYTIQTKFVILYNILLTNNILN